MVYIIQYLPHGVSADTYACTCVHTFSHSFIHTYIHACIHTYVHMFIRSYFLTFRVAEFVTRLPLMEDRLMARLCCLFKHILLQTRKPMGMDGDGTPALGTNALEQGQSLTLLVHQYIKPATPVSNSNFETGPIVRRIPIQPRVTRSASAPTIPCTVKPRCLYVHTYIRTYMHTYTHTYFRMQLTYS